MGVYRMMFGKNYDDEISKIIKQLNENTKSINEVIISFNNLQTMFGDLQKNVINLAKIQSQHKAIISFLVNHASVDEDAQEDLHKMIQEIIKTEKEIKEKKQ